MVRWLPWAIGVLGFGGGATFMVVNDISITANIGQIVAELGGSILVIEILLRNYEGRHEMRRRRGFLQDAGSVAMAGIQATNNQIESLVPDTSTASKIQDSFGNPTSTEWVKYCTQVDSTKAAWEGLRAFGQRASRRVAEARAEVREARPFLTITERKRVQVIVGRLDLAVEGLEVLKFHGGKQKAAWASSVLAELSNYYRASFALKKYVESLTEQN